MCVCVEWHANQKSLAHAHALGNKFRLLNWKKENIRYLRDGSLSCKSATLLTYQDVDIKNQDKTLQLRRTRQSCDRVDCFVAPAIILRPKAARDKGVGTVLCIDTRRVAKTFRVTYVTISLCGVHARALSFQALLFTGTLTLNEIQIDSAKTDSFSEH